MTSTSPTILDLLRDLNRELREAGDRDLSRMVQRAIGANETERLAFLQSNELWGGAGSIADQAAVDRGREVARKVEAALIRLGEEFSPGKGSHLKVTFKGRHSVLPMHSSELKTGTVEAIKKQLGLK